MFQFNDSEGGGNIEKRTYDLMVRLSLENVQLTSLWRQKKISDDEFARRRKVLFHKLAGQYAAAKLIVQDSLPFDKALFKDMVVNDPIRLADFDLLDKVAAVGTERKPRGRLARKLTNTPGAGRMGVRQSPTCEIISPDRQVTGQT